MTLADRIENAKGCRDLGYKNVQIDLDEYETLLTEASEAARLRVENDSLRSELRSKLYAVAPSLARPAPAQAEPVALAPLHGLVEEAKHAASALRDAAGRERSNTMAIRRVAVASKLYAVAPSIAVPAPAPPPPAGEG